METASTATVVRKTHPMFLVAAASVTALSIAGVASLTGWLPQRAEPTAVQAQVAAAPEAPRVAAATPQAPVAEPKARAAARTPARMAPVAHQEPVRDDAPRATRVSSQQPVNDSGIYVENARPVQAQQQPSAQAPAACYDCGTVEAVREIASKGEGTGLGAVAGGLLGGLLGSQIGGGHGKTAMAVVGAAGGAFAGHEVEKRARGGTQYEITVRFDDGATRTYVETQAPQLQNGDRVRLTNGHLALI